MKILSQIQSEIKAPKGNFNSFGKYKYRSAEDIIEAAKIICHKYGCSLTLNDEVIAIAGRFYIKATATITDGERSVTTTAFAREEETKKGMDGAQVTGSASSYARKYALSGLFALDDTKDADALNVNHEFTAKKDVPDDGEKKLLINLVYSSTLDDEGRQKAFESINAIADYDRFQLVRNKLESIQVPFDQIQNPNQSDIKKHVKAIANNVK